MSAIASPLKSPLVEGGTLAFTRRGRTTNRRLESGSHILNSDPVTATGYVPLKFRHFYSHSVNSQNLYLLAR